MPTPRRFSRADPARYQQTIERGAFIRMRQTREAEYGRTQIQFSLNMEDMASYQRMLSYLGRRAMGVVNRRAVRAGMKPVRETMRRLAPRHKTFSKRTGRQLKRTRSSRLGKSIVNNGPWTYRNTGITVGLVGPRWKKDAGGNNPGRYAHLVEQGHKILEQPYRSKKGAKVWARVRPRPFVQPAIKQNISKSIRAMNRVYRQELFKRTGFGRYAPRRAA